jgi:hypothetical protein
MHRVIVPDNLQQGGITAFFSGKIPGSDIDEIATVAGISAARIYLPVQKHTDKVLILDAPLDPRVADAVVTGRKGILIGVQVADCVPLLLHDKKKNVVGVVHAGWRGTASSILKKTLDVMKKRFLCEPQDIMMAIGPSIRGCCYTVGPEVSQAVTQATGGGPYSLMKDGMHRIDLALANREQALRAAISESNIWISEDCTFCNPDRYFSYRYAKGSAGRQAAFIGMV